MKKALVYTGGEFVVAEIMGGSQPDGRNNPISLKLKSGRVLPVPANDMVVLDKDCSDWFELAQFLAGIIGETLALGDDNGKAYRAAQALAKRILASRGITITTSFATA